MDRLFTETQGMAELPIVLIVACCTGQPRSIGTRYIGPSTAVVVKVVEVVVKIVEVIAAVITVVVVGMV